MRIGVREIITNIPVTEAEKNVPIAYMGRPGKDAYQLWLEAGNVGTLEDFFYQKMTFSFPDENDPTVSLTLFVGNDRWRFVEALKDGESTMLFQKKVFGVWQNAQMLDYIGI
jgi:hypothetical protein